MLLYITNVLTLCTIPSHLKKITLLKTHIRHQSPPIIFTFFSAIIHLFFSDWDVASRVIQVKGWDGAVDHMNI